MIFVPLPLFVTIALGLAAIAMLFTRDTTNRTNQLFILLVGLYALQSLLLCLRWGYGVGSVGPLIAALAPLLPVCAYLAYLSLTEKQNVRWFWFVGVVVLNWLILIFLFDFADISILLTFIGFGVAILWQVRAGGDALALARINRVQHAIWAMTLTGVALIASGLVDLYVLVDFIRTDGRNIGLTVTLAQSVFLLCIGVAGLVGQSGATEVPDEDATAITAAADDEDAAVFQRLEALFETDNLHHDTDLNLRRIARRLGLPDRSVSRAINRTQNVSVSQFVNTYRIKDACKLLAETDQTILQISLAAGFLTKSNFNREFSRVTDQTPTQWRRNQLQG